MELMSRLAWPVASLIVASASTLWGSDARAESINDSDEIVLVDYLVIEPLGKAARTPIQTDALLARIVDGESIAPKVGDEVVLPDGSKKTWQSATARPDGALEHAAFSGGYALATITREHAGTMLLDARGNSVVYVNGQLRAGNPYGFDYVLLPVSLREGTNTFLFQVSRGTLNARLRTAKPHPTLNPGDHTLPDIFAASNTMSAGEPFDAWGAVPVINPTSAPVEVSLRADGVGLSPISSPVVRVPGDSVRKVPFRIGGATPNSVGTVETTLRLAQHTGGTRHDVDTMPIQLAIVAPTELHRRTFISRVDGSVQYYAVNPASHVDGSAASSPRDSSAPALILALHGASVEASAHAAAYAPKSWGHLIAPTNRRPFGFDWEDWGRMDALEVLELSAEQYRTDPNRVYMTGHSMGGHGTWQLGAMFPDRFAALGPSAGWISFFTYAGGERPQALNAVTELLARASNPSDTLALLRNTQREGIYILHGDADDNVPVSEARTLREQLATFHHDLDWHEQPGAGHWWDSSDEPGAECVDWPAMFDKFARRRLPSNAEVRDVEFATFNPGISARCFWATIYSQREMLKLSVIQLRCDPLSRRISGTTTNVRRLMLDLTQLKAGAPMTVELDGQKLEKIEWPSNGRLWLDRSNDIWEVSAAPSANEKGPHRYGPFKEAFKNRVMFVYGTTGTDEENAWALGKARFDAESFWYRANGSIDVVADVDFDAQREPERSVILYGNADTNAAWPVLLGNSPVQVRRNGVAIGLRSLTGADLACLFVQPRPGSEQACVAVVSGSGPVGMRYTERLPYFLSGVAFPDFTVIGADALTRGVAGVRAAGFFGVDWGINGGEFSFAE